VGRGGARVDIVRQTQRRWRDAIDGSAALWRTRAREPVRPSACVRQVPRTPAKGTRAHPTVLCALGGPRIRHTVAVEPFQRLLCRARNAGAVAAAGAQHRCGRRARGGAGAAHRHGSDSKRLEAWYVVARRAATGPRRALTSCPAYANWVVRARFPLCPTDPEHHGRMSLYPLWDRCGCLKYAGARRRQGGVLSLSS
jgi:hypothetical protein